MGVCRLSYLVALSLDEALGVLKNSRGKARVIGGATDIFLQDLPDTLVDLTALPETRGINEHEGIITLGSAVTHTEAASSPVILARATALAEASALVGSPQIRNAGTLGGNIVNAAPAADAAVALVALGARAVLADSNVRFREEAVEALYAGYNRSLIDSSSEIMVKLIIASCEAGEGSAFIRFSSRRALSLPLVNAAARVKVKDGLLQEIKLVAAPVSPAPTRLYQVEEMLKGMPAVEETWRKVEVAAVSEVEVRSSLLRCSARYRSHLVGVLVAGALKKAAERAQADTGGGGQ